MAASGLLSFSAVFEDGEAEVSAACLFGVDSSYHLSFVVECLLGLEGALDEC